MSRYDPETHHRRSIRLPGYDYSQPGAYFVTICVQHRLFLLGDIAAGEMLANDAGAMVERWWRDLPRKFPSCEADAFVLMPNHIHGVISIRDHLVGADLRVRPDDPRVRPEDPRVRPEDLRVRPDDSPVRRGRHPGSRTSLSRIVRWFKTMTTNAYIRGVNECGWTPFPGRLWQRNYYEHVVRDEDELDRIRDYIANNPLNWKDDPDNPDNLPPAQHPAS